MIKEPTLMICKKSCVNNLTGQGVAKDSEYWVISCDNYESHYYVFDNKENCHRSKTYVRSYGYLGRIPENKFITLAEFRELRMKSILDE